jgi:hypothetical protein
MGLPQHILVNRGRALAWRDRPGRLLLTTCEPRQRTRYNRGFKGSRRAAARQLATVVMSHRSWSPQVGIDSPVSVLPDEDGLDRWRGDHDNDWVNNRDDDRSLASR